MSTTNYLGLNIPDKNSKGRVVTEVFEPNFTKLDQNAEVVDGDKNAIWGGLDGGGLIEDPSVTKVVGKRYIGADGKAYICLVPSNINNSTNYTPCNVVDNLDKLQNLTLQLEDKIKVFSTGRLTLPQGVYRYTLPSFISSTKVITVIPREFSVGLARVRFVGTTKNQIELEVTLTGEIGSLDIFYFS